MADSFHENQAAPAKEPDPVREGIEVWDGWVRFFHWSQAIAVTGSLITGFLFYFKEPLHFTAPEAKIALTTLHVLIGYTLISVYVGRIFWGFVGPANVRWRNVLPGRMQMRQFWGEFSRFISFKKKSSIAHLLLNRVMISAIFAALLIMIVTGLFRAGVDLSHWPIGPMIKNYVAAEGVDPRSIVFGQSEGIDPDKWRHIKILKFVTLQIHLYTAYTILFLIVTHITGVVLMDVKRRGGVLSPMFTGRRFGLNADTSQGRDSSPPDV